MKPGFIGAGGLFGLFPAYIGCFRPDVQFSGFATVPDGMYDLHCIHVLFSVVENLDVVVVGKNSSLVNKIEHLGLGIPDDVKTIRLVQFDIEFLCDRIK